jgi:putative pyruvate formate lyase activating enzyme
MKKILELYRHCTICPRQCGVNRLEGRLGTCRAPGRPKVAQVMLHQWEEPCLSGTRGSGAVFFSHCNLGCIYCQNYPISHQGSGNEISEEVLAEKFLALQAQGAHNINLVSPTPYLPSIIVSLNLAKNQGLKIPIVYNTNGYELTLSLSYLAELIDIFLPDLKYFSGSTAMTLSGVDDYFSRAAAAISAMYDLAGSTRFNSDGLMEKGLLIRHLILPGFLGESKRILDWIKQTLPGTVYLSLMSQYFPTFKSSSVPEINRRLEQPEYDEVIEYFLDLGLVNGFSQELTSADSGYVPKF